MNFSGMIFFGWYHILDKTIYAGGTKNETIGPKEHSFFITFLFHGINLWTILRFTIATHYKVDVPIFLSLSLALLIHPIDRRNLLSLKCPSTRKWINIGTSC